MSESDAYLDRFLDAARRQDAATMLAQLERAGPKAESAKAWTRCCFPRCAGSGRGGKPSSVDTDVERLATEVGRTWVAGVSARPLSLLTPQPSSWRVGQVISTPSAWRLSPPCCVTNSSRAACWAPGLRRGRSSPLSGPARRGQSSWCRTCGPTGWPPPRHCAPRRRSVADLFYAGAAFGTVRRRRNVPGTFLGTNLQAACATIVATGAGSSHR